MKNNGSKLLPVSNNDEINRLICQATCWEPETEILFDQLRISPGWKCVDLGCGPIGILAPLSNRVGARGEVIGLDANPECIKTANEFINQNRLLNVKVFNGDLYEKTLKPYTFNLTHSRFVFTQIGCDRLLLEMMIELTRLGGVVISQESDWTTWNCYPKNPSWQKIRNALIALYENEGGDINAGQRTYKMFNEVGLADVQMRTTIKALPIGHLYRSGMNQMAMSLRERIIGANILTNDEFDEAMDECNQVVNDPGTIIFSYVLCQVWGYVKKL